jgi:apolipoprotein N-acyltransferase
MPVPSVSVEISSSKHVSLSLQKPVNRYIKRTAVDLLLLSVSALLFAISFPSFLSRWGLFPLAYFCFVPIFILVHRSGWMRTVIYGAIYGFSSYALYNYWLAAFHPLTLIIVPPIYSGYIAIVFVLLKISDSLYPRFGFLLQILIWIGYEFLKVQGFLGYAYGIIGYSQFLFLPLIRIAGITGVWGVSLIVVFPSALLGNALKDGRQNFFSFLTKVRLPVILYGVIFLGAVMYGLAAHADLEDTPRWRVALIQQNVDPWPGGNKTYEKTLRILTSLSNEALKSDPEIVIWSETSFVPAIDWHSRYRIDRVAFNLVKELKAFLAQQEKPFVIGNDDAELVREESGREVRVDYNAALLFENGNIVERYRKIHLVPFTESFPYEKLLPRVYDWLRNADTHFWEKGKEYTVFEAAGVKFSTPICFEDTFGYLARRFVQEGAEVLVNLTNDSWSKSVAAEMQHMSIALFRSVENKRSLVRATNSGITSVIDPNGRIIALLEPFREDFLIAEVPVYTAETTLYSRWGDWFAIMDLVLVFLFFVGGVVGRIIWNSFRLR